eukprot:gene2372-1731_t
MEVATGSSGTSYFGSAILNQLDAIMVGYNVIDGIISTTASGGASWTSTSYFGYPLNDVDAAYIESVPYFITVSGSGAILVSNDTGSTWTFIEDYNSIPYG